MRAQPKLSAERRKALLTSAVVSAAAFSLWGSFQFWGSMRSYEREHPDAIGMQDARFESLRAAVPADATLGYLIDVPPEAEVAMFSIAQYQLAPRILQRGSSQPIVMGYFIQPVDFAELERQQGLRLEHDFGNGVVLFRREANRREANQ
jgi:hypothetical protein